MADNSTFLSDTEIRKSRFIKSLIFLLVLWFGAYFYTNGGWNQCSRYDAIFSFVESGTPDFLSFRIDRFIIDPGRSLNTGDWAKFDGHYYSNKAPGCILLGILVYFPLYYFERLFISSPFPPGLDIFNAYVINLFVSVFILALGAVFFYKILRKLGSSGDKALGLSLVMGLCTPLLPYATSLYAHSTAAAFLIFGVYCMLRKKRSHLYLAGLFWGIAVLCDYLAIVPVGFLTLYICFKIRRDCWFIILGGVIPLLFFMGYHWLCFGNPFCIATMYNNPIYFDSNKVGGVLGGISTYRMLELVFGSRRGLLWCSPVLIFAFGALRKSILFEKGQRGDIIRLSVGIIVSLLLLNSSFNGWHSGWSISPRYLIVTLPFWLILMSSVRYNSWRLPVALILAAYSFFNMLVVSALTTTVPLEICNPLWNELYPRFFHGKFLAGASALKLHFLHTKWAQIIPLSNFNLGSLLGFNGLLSMIPVLVIGGITALPFRKILFSNLRQSFIEIIPTLFEQLCRVWKKHRITLFALAGFIFLYLLWPGNICWISDEASFISLALKFCDKGQWGDKGLSGAVGVSYGPCAVWFYQILLLFTHNPMVMVFGKTVIMLAGIGGGIVMIAKCLQLKWNWGILIIISSPYIYMYSRILWDNVLLLPTAMLSVAFVVNFFCTRKFRYFVIAAFWGYLCVYIHPMSLTLLGALLIVGWGTASRYFFASRTRFIIACGVSILPIIPFALEIISTKISNASQLRSDLLMTLSGNLGGVENITTFGFADHFIPELLKYSSIPNWILLSCSWLGIVIIIFSACCGIFLCGNCLYYKLTKHESLNARDKIFILCIAVLVFHFAMSLTLMLFPFPHYSHMPMLAMLFIVWFGLEILARNKYLKYIGVIFIAIQMIYMAYLVIFINNNGGDRGMFYGATLSNQMIVAEKIGSITDRVQQVEISADVANVRRFPIALKTLLQLRKYYQTVKPKPQPGKVELNIFHPKPYPSGEIDVRIVTPKQKE